MLVCAVEVLAAAAAAGLLHAVDLAVRVLLLHVEESAAVALLGWCPPFYRLVFAWLDRTCLDPLALVSCHSVLSAFLVLMVAAEHVLLRCVLIGGVALEGQALRWGSTCPVAAVRLDG